MNVCVCVKQVPDFDMVLSSDWAPDQSGDLNISYANQIVNCFDENAIELALRLKGEKGEASSFSLHVAAVGKSSVSAMLKRLLPYAVEQAVHIETEEDLRFSPYLTASLLAEYFRENPMDIILTGRQAGEGDSGMVPLFLAEMLGLRCVTNITSLDFEEGRIQVSRVSDYGRETLSLPAPAVLSVGNIDNLALRSYTMAEKLAARSKTVTVYRSKGGAMASDGTVDPAGENDAPARSVTLIKKESARERKVVRPETFEAAAGILLEEIEKIKGDVI